MAGAHDEASPAAVDGVGTEINASDDRPLGTNHETDEASIPLESRVVDAQAPSGDDCVSQQQEQQQQRQQDHHQNNPNREIEQESIKHALHEIISEIDREMEADFANEEVSKPDAITWSSY